MSNGWKNSNRRQRLPKQWAKIHAAILERDHYRCQHIRQDTGQKCGRTATDVDHKQRGDDNSFGNLQSLCTWHHKQKTANEGAQASIAAKQKRGEQQRYTHPGYHNG